MAVPDPYSYCCFRALETHKYIVGHLKMQCIYKPAKMSPDHMCQCDYYVVKFASLLGTLQNTLNFAQLH